MAHFSRHDKKQPECIDQVYAVMKRHEGPIPRGQLMRDTGRDATWIAGALEVLAEEGLIVRVPKSPEELEGMYSLAK
jgi:DNA-binding HxlR family transcriptional regulator